jgi:MinD-like ATPase involved in chromosome partitioning or flagellar assembly
MKTITFYSYKGGVGRSLTLSNIAMRLADLGKKVVLLILI